MASKASLIIFSLLIAYAYTDVSVDDLIDQVFNQKSTDGVVDTSTQTVIPQTTKPTVVDRGGAGDAGKAGGARDAYRPCGKEKECVPRHLCVDGSISTTGENFIDIRINDGVCKYSEVCCDIPNKRNQPVIPAVPTEQHEGCGWRNSRGVGFKITGATDNEAEFGEFPWMVAILRAENGGDELIYLYECGGALIAPNVVLTAAHCTNNRLPYELMARGGEWDTQNTDEILNHVDKPGKEIISHEKYNKGSLYNDISLLILEDSFTWQENIRPICLPPPNTNFDHSRCYATGWGKDKFGNGGKYQVILKKIDLPVIPAETCQNQLRQTRLGLYYNLHESFLCAGGEKGKDTCKGDGGSPLVCPIPGVSDRYYQAGIVAWGIGCNEENVPGIYANVAHLRPWISEKLAARGIQFSHFTA